MKKIGVVFPGQGSQKIGMGKRLYDGFDSVKSIFKRADEILGFSITELCFNGPEEELRQTYNTQPALLLVSYAIWEVLRNKVELRPAFMAGHSLGEYTALLASGFFSFDDAIMITRKRGLYMEEACPKGKGGMVALIGADMEKISPVLRDISHDDYVAVPANMNSAEQVVLSGDINALKEAVEKLKGVGYKKAVFLNVSGPFHSPLMRDAAEKLKGELDRIKPMDMTTPVISNVDAEPVVDKNMVMDKLYRQMFSPVLWEATVKRMAKEGVEVFLEVGPQKVLANLIKRIVPDIPCYNIEEIEDIDAIRGIVA
ncbi:MAG TPA: ACP S-malonyltransferase [Syntrophorhabdaceae bacterium]|nr:ACP S-malonyltransferase [Syntrophorhabdaceae bacterium]HOL05340.1 ACP S-malonyltransferase [Syntrophorhabdaceae bacterium]HON85061.1 ACP S-malonyltransferase [Syntrophorhabdaceae bacterium]HOT41520.1 ACP S-malonyltransferase [Syntrophorhabdaceae bacterium]HPC65818.1 ACP S-malonyltransferase [Syntrophorhabdaceae bacterium]